MAPLLLLLLLRAPRTPGATCPTPAPVEHADIQVKSYHLHSRERYVCNSGFKRKAGTSSLTECVFNRATNMTHWTTPNLRCIRDPSLTHQKPVPPSTVVTARVTPEPESPSLSGKEPAALSPKSDTTLATETATVPGPWMMSSKPPSVGTTGIGSHEPSQTPSQTASVTLEHTPSTSHETPGALPDSSRYATVIIATSAPGMLAVCVVAALLVRFVRSRNTSQPPAAGMEPMEAMPMTGGTGSREADRRNCPLNL